MILDPVVPTTTAGLVPRCLFNLARRLARADTTACRLNVFVVLFVLRIGAARRDHRDSEHTNARGD